MAVAFTYRNLSAEIINNFEGFFITQVVSKNNSLTFTEAQLEKYLLNSNDDENITANQTRLLLEADGSLNIIEYAKRNDLLRTNVLGIRINVFTVA